MNETIPVRFDILHAYAEDHRLDYNELCRMVRDAIAEGSRSLADKKDRAFEMAYLLQYAAYSHGFEAGKVGQHVDTTIAGNRSKAALDRLLTVLADASPRCDHTRYCDAWPNCSPPCPVIAKETPGKIEGFRYIETAYVQPETVNSGVGGGVSNG